MDAAINDLVEHLVAVYVDLAPEDRYLVGVSGAPGSGKTTIAAKLVSMLNDTLRAMTGNDVAAMLPMDGFHYYRSELDQFPDPEEAHARRGAPNTFNAEKYVALVRSLKENSTVLIHAPSFDHSAKDPVENDIAILPNHRIVILEGNYVHLTVHPWEQATEILDERWFITVERDIAKDRVIQRHLAAGIAKTEQEAANRFEKNDWPNGEYLLKHSNVERAHRVIHSVQDEDMSEK